MPHIGDYSKRNIWLLVCISLVGSPFLRPAHFVKLPFSSFETRRSLQTEDGPIPTEEAPHSPNEEGKHEIKLKENFIRTKFPIIFMIELTTENELEVFMHYIIEHQIESIGKTLMEPNFVILFLDQLDNFMNFAQKNLRNSPVRVKDISSRFDTPVEKHLSRPLKILHQKDISVRSEPKLSEANLPPITQFMSTSEINLWLAKAQLSGFATVSLLGESFERRPIMQLQIGDRKKKMIFMEATIHAREWIAPAALLYAIRKILIEKPPVLFSTYQLVIVPVANPDGYEFTRTSINQPMFSEEWFNRFWRKNRRSLSPLCVGVDLNRNFNVKFSQVNQSSFLCMAETNPGPEPFSETESRLVRDFVEDVGKQLHATLSVHSFGQYILLPYSFTANIKEQPNDFMELRRVASEMAKAMSIPFNQTYQFGTVYEIQNVTITGGMMDWIKSMGVPYPFAVELRPVSDTLAFMGGFNPTEDQISLAGEELFAGILAMAKTMKLS